jgi:hypothetical protein
MIEQAREPSIITYYKEEAAKLRGEGPKKMVRIKAPDATSQLILRSGHQAKAFGDGSFEVPEEDAPRYLGRGWTKLD